jgi:NitT/TauT family transport system substrate-binding protein
VVYSPLSFQIAKSGEARTILDYATAVPPNLTAGWIVLDKFAETKPEVVQKGLNALYGALQFMRANRDVTVKLIAELYEMPPEIAGMEYDNTIMKLETDGNMAAPNVAAAVQLSLDLAKLGGLKDIVPVEDVISTKFKPVPTKP